MKAIRVLLSISLIAAISAVSCGPSKKVDTGIEKRCLPHSLSLIETENNYARIAWNPGCPGIRIMRGFNIYLSSEPVVKKYPGAQLPSSIKPFNKEIYPGDTVGNPNRETYECKDIDNLTAYYVHVRAVYNDNTLSPPTNEIKMIVYPQGEILLKESFSGNRDGFSFEKNDYCRTDDLENDIYFYHKDDEYFLCSPERLGAIQRATEIYEAGQGETLGVKDEIKTVGDSREKVSMAVNDLFILITEDGYPVKVRVDGISEEGEDRSVRLEYIYKPPVEDKTDKSS